MRVHLGPPVAMVASATTCSVSWVVGAPGPCQNTTVPNSFPTRNVAAAESVMTTSCRRAERIHRPSVNFPSNAPIATAAPPASTSELPTALTPLVMNHGRSGTSAPRANVSSDDTGGCPWRAQLLRIHAEDRPGINGKRLLGISGEVPGGRARGGLTETMALHGVLQQRAGALRISVYCLTLFDE